MLCGWTNLPWFNVTSLLHESSQWEPKTVEDSEVIRDRGPISVVFNVPLEWTESAHQKQYHTNLNEQKIQCTMFNVYIYIFSFHSTFIINSKYFSQHVYVCIYLVQWLIHILPISYLICNIVTLKCILANKWSLDDFY